MIIFQLTGIDSALDGDDDDTLLGKKSLTQCVEGALIGAMVDPPAELDHDYTRCVGWQKTVGF